MEDQEQQDKKNVMDKMIVMKHPNSMGVADLLSTPDARKCRLIGDNGIIIMSNAADAEITAIDNMLDQADKLGLRTEIVWWALKEMGQAHVNGGKEITILEAVGLGMDEFIK